MSGGFTPGPWRLGMMGGEKLTHVVDMGDPPKAPFVALNEGAPPGPGFTGFSHSAVVHSDGDRCEMEANARLIAAAPELYAALEKLADENSNFVLGPSARAFARVILAKARGERDEDAELLLDGNSHYSPVQLEEIALARARGETPSNGDAQ